MLNRRSCSKKERRSHGRLVVTSQSAPIIPSVRMRVNDKASGVTSSRLCKYTEGAIFPVQVESLEDGVDDAVHVDEADHGPGAAADFDETAFDDVGGAQLAP